MKKLIASLVIAVTLVFGGGTAVASSNQATWRPTIANGGLPYGIYRTDRRGYWEVCFQYVGRADICYRIAAFTPWGPLFWYR